ncbi:hypothetical protein GCM10009850_038950 [Nonomuraea monospora]|uniref:Uncharacterized protein n=1 Tax=Nonomuraea monospora TaxID=568818 RepID=A0ABN3CGV3_9ACTN
MMASSERATLTSAELAMAFDDVLVHHVRKVASEDFLSEVSASVLIPAD